MSHAARHALRALLAGALLAPAVAAAQDLGQTARLTPDPGASQFGSAVAVGDGIVAVGAYGGGAGAVYLYKRDPNGSWPRLLQQPLSRGATGDRFGFDVALDETQLVVGAPSAQRSGAAYLYDLSGKLIQTLPIPGRAGAEVGSAVAVSGKLIAVGARRDSGAGAEAGRVYVFFNGILEKELTAPSPAPGDQFGLSLALDGERLVVGAPFSNLGGGLASGAAYVFERNRGAWDQVSKLSAPLHAEDAFGYAVAVRGDQIAVGAPLDDTNGQDAGAVYRFVRGADGWHPLQDKQNKLMKGDAGDQFGVAVSLDGDKLLVGARRHGQGRAGAAYRFNAGGDLLDLLQASPPKPGSELGFAAALHGDTALVGAFLENNGAGAAYVFEPAAKSVAVTIGFELAETSVHEDQPELLLKVIAASDGNPTAPITVDVSVDPDATASAGDFQLLTRHLDFSSGAPQYVHIAIVNDAFAEPLEAFTVRLSNPSNGATLGQAFETVTIQDDDTPGLAVTPTTPPPLVTTESGGSATFTVQLTSRPTKKVTISLTSSNPIEGTISPALLTFNPGTWDQPQTVTVTGVDDSVPDGDVPYAITLAATSNDPAYAALAPLSVQALNRDNDQVTGTKQVCALADGKVIYTLVLTDHGAPQIEAQLADVLPPELNLVAAGADIGAATVDPATRTVTWRGPLSQGAPATITILATVVPEALGQEVSNQATFAYDADGNGSDETSNRTDDPDLPGSHSSPRPTAFTAGASPPRCPSVRVGT